MGVLTTLTHGSKTPTNQIACWEKSFNCKDVVFERFGLDRSILYIWNFGDLLPLFTSNLLGRLCTSFSFWKGCTPSEFGGVRLVR